MGSRKRINSTGHQGCTVPALLKTAFNQFAASAAPALLRHVLQVMKQLPRPSFLHVMGNPDFWQTLVWRHAAGHPCQKFALHGSGYTFNFERICPQRGDGQVRGLCQAQHKPLAYAEIQPGGASGWPLAVAAQHKAAGSSIMPEFDHVDFSAIQ